MIFKNIFFCDYFCRIHILTPLVFMFGLCCTRICPYCGYCAYWNFLKKAMDNWTRRTRMIICSTIAYPLGKTSKVIKKNKQFSFQYFEKKSYTKYFRYFSVFNGDSRSPIDRTVFRRGCRCKQYQPGDNLRGQSDITKLYNF